MITTVLESTALLGDDYMKMFAQPSLLARQWIHARVSVYEAFTALHTSLVSVFRAMPVSTVDTDHTSVHGDIREEFLEFFYVQMDLGDRDPHAACLCRLRSARNRILL